MTLVIDASAAFEVLLRARADTVLEENSELVAPDLIVAELFNARWKNVRSGVLAPSDDSILEFLARIQIMPSLPYASGAARMSERLDHPIYDCFYVTVAQQENIRFLTSDARLVRKLRLNKLGSVLA
jgi:predicted nucleic acid-binding protein